MARTATKNVTRKTVAKRTAQAKTPVERTSPYDLTAEQKQLVAIINEIGPNMAARAAKHDADATFPFEDYDDMRRAGVLGLCVPKAYGGLGADYTTYCLVSAELGRYSGATALTFNMHVACALWTSYLTDGLTMTKAERAEHEHNRRIHYARMVKEGKVYAQPFSEGGAAAAGKAPFGTLATKVEGGWVLNGKKIFASLAGAADYYGVLATEDKPDRSRRDTLFVGVPADAQGVSVVGPWDPLGMRATVSRTLLLKDVFVPDEAQLMPRGLYHQAAMRWPHMFLTLCPTYMGIAQAAYDFTIQYLRGEVEGQPPVKRRMYPTKQIAVAEMFIKLEQTWALFHRVIREARVDPPKRDRLRAYAAQYTVMENCNDICRLAIRTCGGQSMLKSLPLERFYRDSRCGSLMLPWTAELCVDRLGREALYEPGETDE
jgi:alkylation response protein AidB-like acyl-CoA dehydrogenase